MLCLTRKHNESTHLWVDGKYIGRIVVNDIDRGKVKLGFEMSRSVKIARDELLTEEKRKELR